MQVQKNDMNEDTHPCGVYGSREVKWGHRRHSSLEKSLSQG